MHSQLLACLLALLALLAATSGAAADTSAGRDALVQRMLDRVNSFRAEQGLGALRADDRIAAAAQAHTETMLDRQCFAHTCEGETDLGRRLERAGYLYRVASENIAAGFSNPETVVERWIRSETHRQNMLMPELTEAGVGYLRIPRGADPLELGTYWTLDMGTLRGQRPVPPRPVRRPEREVAGVAPARATESSDAGAPEAAGLPELEAEPHPLLTRPPAWIGRAQPIRRHR